jgi:hypothetical protein
MLVELSLQVWEQPMDTRTSTLVVSVYLAGAVIVLAVGLGYFAYQHAHTPGLSLDPQDQSLDVAAKQRALAKYAARVTKSGPALRQMETKLAITREILEKTATDLNQRNAELKHLRGELDESFKLIFNMVSSEARPEVETGSATALAKDTDPASPDSRAKLESELARLRESLARAELLDGEREAQFAQLQKELLQADLELTMVQEESKREVDFLAAEKKVLEDTTVALIARCGVIAVPWLIELLEDERVEIRRWSARALGAMGVEAQEAVTPLRELLVDPDEDVRTAAQRALKSIGTPPAE